MIRRIECFLIAGFMLTSAMASAAADDEGIAELKGRIRAIRGDATVPAQADVGIPIKCGTPEMVSAFNVQRHRYDVELAQVFERPNLPFAFQSEHFVIHYAVADTHAIYHPNEDVSPVDGVPDFVNRMSEVFEHVWSIEIDTLQYNPPPQDDANGGNGLLDVYAVNLGFGFFGFTVPEDIFTGHSAFSYIILENDFAESSYRDRPLDAVKVTAAHEFFHTVQFGYDVYEYEGWQDSITANDKPWWLEASSTWMEDVVYDEVNDYRGYLRFFYKYLWMSLTTFSPFGNISAYHPYASCIWPMYISEKYNDPAAVREIWERCGDVEGYNVLPATDDALVMRGSSLDGAFLEFSVWNFHTGPFADTALYFSEGDSFPVADTTALIENLDDMPYYPLDNLNFPPEDLAANFIIIVPSPVTGGVTVTFDGSDLTEETWVVGILGYRPQTGLWTSIPLTTDTWQGVGEWRNWNSYAAIVVIPVITGINSSADERHPYTGRLTYGVTLSLQRDVGPVQFLSLPAAGRRGDPISPVVRFSNQGREEASFQAQLVISDLQSGDIAYNQTVAVNALPVNNATNVEFPQFTPTGIDVRYVLRAISIYNGDQLTRNDTLSAVYRSLGGVGRLNTAYPSPFVITGDNLLTIPVSYDTADPETRLLIYDASGGLVREVAMERHPTQGASFLGFKWDGRNENGDYVASGVYFYIFSSDGDSRTGKIAVLNRR